MRNNIIGAVDLRRHHRTYENKSIGCRQDDGDSLLNKSDELIMAALLLFDGVDDDYVRRQQRR